MSQNLESLVGQSLMLAFVGSTATPELLDALAQARAAGVVLFADNIQTPAGVHDLIRTLQGQAAALGLPPLLVAVDQEGGIVSRLPEPFTTVPSQMAQAATGDSAAAHGCALITARQLRAVGINLNFAPVLDVNCNPANPVIGTRSFSENPDIVTRFGLAALRGYKEAGVIATVKHFPGHGDTEIDSHLGLPVVRHDIARLKKVELAPYAAAVQAGVPAVMSAHVVLEAIDELPATLSAEVLTGLLRRDLGFDGVVFTDDLTMRAITDRYGLAQAAVRAKAAGADVLVLAVRTLDEQVSVARALRDAVASGALPAEIFEATADRLDRLRSAYGISTAVSPFIELEPTLAQDVLAIARRSITVVQGQERLPLPADTRVALIDCLLPRWSRVEEAVERAALLRELVEQAFPAATSITVDPEPTEDDLARARPLAGAADTVLLVTRDAQWVTHQVQLARELAASGTPLIHAAVRGPYDGETIRGAAATLVTYGDPPVSLRALVDILAGRAKPEGTLPVRLEVPPPLSPADERVAGRGQAT
ncbi:MAG: beta-N-acetylhexosaminidase [Chloroflexota bacterium]|nr:beta-N-acetylhexosaminidase [Chloroflexota bacterium]